MNFQLQAFNPAAAAASQLVGAFADVTILEYNSLKNNGDGFLEVHVGGQILAKDRTMNIVIGGFSGAHFQETRRQFWMGEWKKGQEATPPDCFSQTGDAPHADAPHKQSASCRTCPRSEKGADGYVGCAHSKDVVVYLVKGDASGNAAVDLNTPLVWKNSAMSLFAKYDQASASGGLNAIIGLLLKNGVRLIEQVVFEIGFHQTSKAPTLKVIGQMPVPDAERVITASAQPDVKMLLEYRAPKVGKPAGAPAALPAAQPAQALAAPQQVAQVVQPVAAPLQAAGIAASIVPAASPAAIAAVTPPAVLAAQVAPAVQAAPRTQALVMAEMQAAMASGDSARAQTLMLEFQAMSGAIPAATPTPQPFVAPGAAQNAAAGPVAQVAPAAAQNAALAAFSLAGAR